MWRGEQRGHRLFDGPAENYSIQEQPVPKGVSYEQMANAEKQGLRIGRSVKDMSHSIPTQPIPKELLEMEEEPDIEPGSLLYSLKWVQPDGSVGFSRPRVRPKSLEIDQRELSGEAGVEAVKVQNAEEPKKDILIHHIPERKLWLAQREAGTNEQWREINRFGVIIDIPVEKEPEWNKDAEYHPMFVLKPKTVKYYFCLCRRKNGGIVTMSRTCKDRLKYAVGDATIIGNIEERDVEV